MVTNEGPGLSPPHAEPVAVGVEEEFHTVDLRTRRLTAQADSLIQQLPASSFGSELQRSVLEANSRPWVRLADLAEDVAARPPGEVDMPFLGARIAVFGGPDANAADHRK